MTTQALARLKAAKTQTKTQTVALTDVKGAAAAVQKIFDTYKLGLKVTPKQSGSTTDTTGYLHCKGKSPYGRIDFMLSMDSDKKDLWLDWADRTGCSFEEVTNLSVMLDTSFDVKGTSRKELDLLRKFLIKVKDTAPLMIEAVKEITSWNTRFQGALEKIKNVMANNRE